MGTAKPDLISEPELLERGRYAIAGMPDGSWQIIRAGPLCEACSECGCGEQQDPLSVPAIAVQAFTGQLSSAGKKMLGKMAGMMGKVTGG